MMVVAVPRRPHCCAATNEMPRPIAIKATPSAAPVAKAGSRAVIPAATASAPNAISTLIASDPVSRLASARRRSASCSVSLPSSTSRVMSRTIRMAGLPSRAYTRTSCRQFERPLEDAPEPIIRSLKNSRPLRSWTPDLSGMRSPRRWVQELYLLGHQQGAELRGKALDEILVREHGSPMRPTDPMPQLSVRQPQRRRN